MPQIFRRFQFPVLLAAALALIVAGCGDDEESSDAPAPEPESAAGLDPAAVETSVEEFLAEDEYAAGLSPSVDCGEEAAETLDCVVTGDKGLEGVVSAAPSQGFEYTGEIEGPDGLSSIGGSQSEGSAADPASIEAGLDEVLADDAGKPTADCPDEAGGASLECEVTGDGVSGTLTVTPIGGFEWQGEIETADGTRAIAGNELP